MQVMKWGQLKYKFIYCSPVGTFDDTKWNRQICFLVIIYH